MTLAVEPEVQASAGALRLCVIDSAETGPAYPRLTQCTGLQVVGHLPWLDASLIPWDLGRDLDAIVVGCGAAQLRDLAFQEQMLKLARRARVLLVAVGDCDYAVAAQLGVRGLVSREVEPAAIERVVAAVAAGELAFPRSALSAVVALIGRLPLRAASVLSLTPRQQEVIGLIAAGATDREVASRLRISESTAHKHVQNALRRTRAKTRSQLVALLRQDVSTTA